MTHDGYPDIQFRTTAALQQHVDCQSLGSSWLPCGSNGLKNSPKVYNNAQPGRHC